MNLPYGLILAVIIRNGDTIIPKGDTLICCADRLVLAAEPFRHEEKIDLREILIKEDHGWIGNPIKDLDISRQTLIVLIKRKNKVIIPSGSTVIKQGDKVVLYTKLTAKNL